MWIAYQLLEGLATAHAAGVCHGDLKAENVLVTSWHWLYLADFASYKPVRLPSDNPVRLCWRLMRASNQKARHKTPNIHETLNPTPNIHESAWCAHSGHNGARICQDGHASERKGVHMRHQLGTWFCALEDAC